MLLTFMWFSLFMLTVFNAVGAWMIYMNQAYIRWKISLWDEPEESMNQEPAPIEPIDLLELREAVKAFNELVQPELLASYDSLNEVVRALNAIIENIDPEGVELSPSPMPD